LTLPILSESLAYSRIAAHTEKEREKKRFGGVHRTGRHNSVAWSKNQLFIDFGPGKREEGSAQWGAPNKPDDNVNYVRSK